MNENYEIKKEDYEQYWQKGGTYLMPVEVFNDLFYVIEQLQQENYNLRQINEEHQKLNGKLRKENNILTEFENWLEEHSKQQTNNMFFGGVTKGYEFALNKLQELKGDDK